VEDTNSHGIHTIDGYGKGEGLQRYQWDTLTVLSIWCPVWCIQTHCLDANQNPEVGFRRRFFEIIRDGSASPGLVLGYDQNPLWNRVPSSSVTSGCVMARRLLSYLRKGVTTVDKIFLSIYLSTYLSVYLSIFLNFYRSIYLYISMHTYIYLHIHLYINI